MTEKIKKTCPGCGVLKTVIEDFSTDPSTRNGYASHCKTCKKFESEQRRRKRAGLPLLPDTRKQQGHKELPIVSTRSPKKTYSKKRHQKSIGSPAISPYLPIDPKIIRSTILTELMQATGVIPSRTIEKIRQEWWHPVELIKDEVVDDIIIITLMTGGWSGNQDIIDALSKSSFWKDWWERSERNGTHVFKIDASVWANGLDFKR